MINFIRKILKRSSYALIEHAWSIIVLLLFFSYFAGYTFMFYGNEKEIVDSYFWFYMVSSTTVGYGDMSPSSMSGRIGAILIMLIGIGVMAIIIGKIAETIIGTITKELKGLSKMHDSDHIIIMGYRKNSTEKIVEELLQNDPNERIVLCSESLDENPFSAAKVGYIKGETASVDVMKRSCAENAKKIIIHGRDDNQTFFTAYALREINTTAHMVCYFTNEDHVNKIYKLPADNPSLNQVVLPVNVYLMAQELQDPESSTVFQHLISNLNGATLYRLDMPPSVEKTMNFSDVFFIFKQKYDATVLAIKKEEIISNPDLKETVCAGNGIFYIAKNRISEIDWREEKFLAFDNNGSIL